MLYEYDFGDGWVHRVILESTKSWRENDAVFTPLDYAPKDA